LSLARHVRRTVYEKTGVVIELEPELVGFTPAEIAAFMSLD
jgi:UDP-N-acetylenolpyruvoylglucosamine reductase